jgi:CHASE1-domain containing sensor protein
VNAQILGLLLALIGLFSGLIATYVSLQNRALLAEVRQEIAEMENRLIGRINGTYIRRSECELREGNLHERVDALVEDVRRISGEMQQP